MFKKILQICFCSILLLLLTTGSLFSDAFPLGILLAEHNSTHQGTRSTDQTPAAPTPEATSGAPSRASSPPTAQAPQREPAQAPALKAPKEPIDPYDYDALREADEAIYGAGK
jgi:hypothetical protein